MLKRKTTFAAFVFGILMAIQLTLTAIHAERG
jgi:hypothetical protein